MTDGENANIFYVNTDALWDLNTYHAGIGFTEQNCVCFLTYLKFEQLFHKLMNQSIPGMFVLISFGDSKYGHEIPKCCHFWQFCNIFDLSSALACHAENINKTYPLVLMVRLVETRQYFTRQLATYR